MGIFDFFKQTTSANDNHNAKDARKAECPYCHKLLEKIPTKKTKCLHCGQFIFVRTNPENKSRVVATETGVKKIDRQWSEIQFYKKWLENLAQFNVTEKDFQTKKEALTKKFGQEAKTRDVIWGIFNNLVASVNDLQQLKIIYYDMALFLNEEGRDCFHILEQCAELELRMVKQNGYSKVQISTSKNVSCKECQKQDGIILTIEEALKKMLLPCKKCSFRFKIDKKSFCRCMYLAVTD